MMTTLCERCFPAWRTDGIVVGTPPILPCLNCSSMGKRHVFAKDPRKPHDFMGKKLGPIPTDGTALDNNELCKTLLAIIVLWNDGNPVLFSQQDFDKIAGSQLLEGFTETGMFCIGLQQKKGPDDVPAIAVPGSDAIN